MDTTDRAKIAYWRYALKRAWNGDVKSILASILASIKTDRNFDRVIIAAALADMAKSGTATVTEIAKVSATIFAAGSELNLYPLKALIDQRISLIDHAVSGYRHLIQQTESTRLTIGRRGQDVVRELTLGEMERAFLGGSPNLLLRKNFLRRLKASAKSIDPDKIDSQTIHQFYRDFADKVPTFSIDGKPKFMLSVQTDGQYLGNYRAYDVGKYTDLVSLTTVDEARWTASEQRAENIGTRFMQFNKLDRDYKRDPVCAAINGRAFSLVDEAGGDRPGAMSASNKFYPYLYSVIRGQYKLPHPFCKHQPRPIPESYA